MNLNKRLQAMAAATAALLLAGMATAGETYTTTGNNPNWRNAASWTHTGSPTLPYPTSANGDTAIVQHNLTINDPDGCFALTLDAGVVLTISSTKSLTIDASGTAAINGELDITGGRFIVSSSAVATVDGAAGGSIYLFGDSPRMTVDGTVQLFNNSGVAGIYADPNEAAAVPDATIDGSGSILSDDVANLLMINLNTSSPTNHDIELKLDTVSVAGALAISDGGWGHAVLNNQGFLEASHTAVSISAPAYIVLSGLTDIKNASGGTCGSPRWKVDASDVLQFDVGTSTMASPFVVAGTLLINNGAAVRTNGNLDFVSGSAAITVNGGAQFVYSGTACGGGCNPGSPVNVNRTCP